ncbi:hypothetical protein B0H12DRAFT_95931 [Mycena haematopus]|nr:hypothetical protein B0H12DRAFT_95931 [Mycena haematopus]
MDRTPLRKSKKTKSGSDRNIICCVCGGEQKNQSEKFRSCSGCKEKLGTRRYFCSRYELFTRHSEYSGCLKRLDTVAHVKKRIGKRTRSRVALRISGIILTSHFLQSRLTSSNRPLSDVRFSSSNLRPTSYTMLRLVPTMLCGSKSVTKCWMYRFAEYGTRPS